MIELLLINRDRVGASSRSQRSAPPSHCSIIDRTVGGRLSSSRHLSLLVHPLKVCSGPESRVYRRACLVSRPVTGGDRKIATG